MSASAAAHRRLPGESMGVSRISAPVQVIGKYLACRPNHVLVAFAAFIIIGRGTMLGFALDARSHAALAAAEQSARSFAQVLAEHTARTFEAVDRTIGAAELIRRDADAGRYATAEAVHEDLRRLQQTSRALIAIGWTNAAGDVVAHSYEAAPPRPNIAQLPHFITHRDNPAAGLFGAPPFRSPATGNWITAASRRLNNPDGSFAGVVTAALDQSYFASTYRAIRLENGGAAVLIHREGPIIARDPPVKGAVGKNFSSRALLSRYLPASNAGSFSGPSVVDGIDRIVGYRAVTGLPLVVVVSYERAAVLQPFYAHIKSLLDR